jgi:transposase-like protein
MTSSGDAQKRQAWKARFASYRSSGLSVARFCEQEGVSTHTFYYWAKRLRMAATAAPSRVNRAFPPRDASATATTDGNRRGAMVRFRWKTGVEVSVPADCLEAIRCLAECLAKAGDHRSEAFQEVVVKA